LPCSPAMTMWYSTVQHPVSGMLPNESHLLRKEMKEGEALSWEEHFQG
jgi:hypothetical protein